MIGSMDEGAYGAAVRRRRLARTPKMSQQRLADAVGIDRTYLNRIENGGIGLPQDDLRGRIARALGTTDEELLRDARVTQLAARRGGQIVSPSVVEQGATDSGEWVAATEEDRAEMHDIVDEVGLDDLAVLLRVGRLMPRGRG